MVQFIQRRNLCRDCNNQYRRERYAASPEQRIRIQAENRAWRTKNVDEYRANHREYARLHAAEAAERSRRFREKRADYVRECKRQYYLDNAERIRANVAAWRRENPDKHNATNEARRARQRNAPGADYTTVQHIRWRWEMWGGRCWICGDRATATDHVIPLCAGGSHWPANLRPICRSCNSRRSKKRPVIAAEFIAATMEVISESACSDTQKE